MSSNYYENDRHTKDSGSSQEGLEEDWKKTHSKAICIQKGAWFPAEYVVLINNQLTGKL